jgi:hypothetical protein
MKPLALSMIPLILAGCASSHPAHDLTQPPIRMGPAEDFGLKITDVAGLDVDYTIDHPAFVVAMRVTPPRMVEVVTPRYQHTQSSSGHHYARAGAPSFPVGGGNYTTQRTAGKSGCPPLPPGGTDASCSSDPVSTAYSYYLAPAAAPTGGYWLIIVSDLATSNAEIAQRLQTMAPPDTSLVSLVRSIPEALIAARTAHWAAYYAAFGQAQKP